MKKKERLYIQFIYYVIMIFWMELIYQLFTYRSLSWYVTYQFLFTLGLASVFTMLSGVFPRKVNKVSAYIFTILTFLFYATQLVYQSLFRVPLLWGVAEGAADDVTAYWREALVQIIKNLPALLLMLLPVVALIILNKKYFQYQRRSLKLSGVLLLVCATLQLFPVLLIDLSSNESIPYVNYYEMSDKIYAAKTIGIFTTFRRNLQGVGSIGEDISEQLASMKTETKMAQSKKETKSEEAKLTHTEEPFDTSPNVMNIDFASLAAGEKDEDVKALHEYMAGVTPTNKNKYTGMFKGKNLIFITAETFSPFAVDRTLTPTLYKLTHEGFVFNNFYTSLWDTSTSDGEYIANLSLLPDGSHSLKRTCKNELPFTMGKQFDRLGITSYAYHDATLSYYDRNLTHPNLGYDFKAATLGDISKKDGASMIFKMENADDWPASDYDMMVATLPEYVNSKPFHAYYMTVSGHCLYRFDEQKQSMKNKAFVDNLPYADDAKAYLAANIELDKAMKYLIEELDKKGVLNDTVIAMSGDHYPYALYKSSIDQLAGHKVESTFELYKNHFILWSGSMKEPIEINKTGSSLDILPTLSNLFGFTYDSRLMAGRDLLSDCEGVAILSNRSFITDKVKYNNSTQEITYLVDKSQVPDSYINDWVNEIKARFIASAGILNKDYYKKIEKQLVFP